MFGIDDAIIGGAVIGAGASIFGAHKSASSASAVNAAQLAFSREAAQNKYQWAVKDMEKAGLNPKLAGTQSASVSGAQVPNLKNPGDAWAQAGAAISGSVGQATSAYASAITDIKNADTARMNAQTERLRQMSQAGLQDSQSAAALAQANSFAAQARYYDRLTGDAPDQRDLWKAQAGAYRKESWVADSKRGLNYAHRDLMRAQKGLIPFERGRLESLSAKQRSETSLIERKQQQIVSEIEYLRALRDKAYADKDLSAARSAESKINAKYQELIYGSEYWRRHDMGEFYRNNSWKVPFDEYAGSAQKLMDVIDSGTEQIRKFVPFTKGSNKTFNFNIRR